MPYAVLAAALVALDQLVKYLVSHNIPLGGHVPFLPHLVELTYFQNTGAAFSMLEEHTWLLTLISAVMSVVLGVAVWKKFFAHPFGRCALTLVLAGAVGNRPGSPGLCSGHVQRPFYGLRHLQCGRYLRGGGRDRRLRLLCLFL